MIRHRFSVFSGIGPKREQMIWAAGISDWQEFLEAGEVPGLPAGVCRSVATQIRQWSSALERGDARFFANHVARTGHWALFEEFGDSVRYLDIETTGLSPGRDSVTVIGIYDGKRYEALINGQGLSAQALRDALEGCKLLVTYYGTVFDVPFLQCSFPEVPWDIPHFDLCFAGRKVGLTGGLKGVERTLGMVRDESIVEVDGYEAVRLWRRHQKGDPTALKTLIEYNEADTRNLADIASIVYERLSKKGRS